MNIYKFHNNPEKLNLYQELADALTDDDGTVRFSKYGIGLHRDDDKPAVIAFNPLELKWFKNGKLHRDGDKPALIKEDLIYWIKHGDLHRDDGPAVILKSGMCKYYWSGAFVKSEIISEKEAKRLIDYYIEEAKNKK